jgi:hypothetical protein
MSTPSTPAFGPKCPSGGTWWACGTGTYFVGCCTRNPCQITCAAGDLYPAGFDPVYHGNFSDASCGSGVSFWTCTAGNTFLGCCKANPCSATGCSRDNLAPSFLNTEDLRIEYGAIAAPSSSSTTRSSSTSSATTSGTASAATIVPHKDSSPTAAIAGGTAGGVLVLSIIIGLLVYYFCHAKKSRKGHEESMSRRQSDLPAMMAAHDQNQGMHPPDIPPSYMSPKPGNFYAPQAGQYHDQHSQYQYTPAPQELPIEPGSPTFLSRKPVAGHQRNVSELSGDTAIRSELETPLGSPHGKSQFTPLSTPQMQTQAEWQSPVSAQNGQQWGAHQSWQTQNGSEYSYAPAQGLGVYGTAENDTNLPGHRPGANVRDNPRI